MGIVGLLLVIARSLCHIPAARACAASSVSLAAAAWLGGLSASYLIAAIVAFVAAPAALTARWGRP